MTVVVNGEPREVPDGLNVAQLLGHLGIAADRVAIERNRGILPRTQWIATAVAANDSYEIVHFVGGGQGDACGEPQIPLRKCPSFSLFVRR